MGSSRVWYVGVLLMVLLVMLAGCSGSGDDGKEKGTDDSSEKSSEKTGNTNFGKDINFLEVSTVFFNSEDVNSIDNRDLEDDIFKDGRFDDKSFIEYEGNRYVEYEFITALLDSDVLYDEDEEKTLEIRGSKESIKYRPSHESTGGAIVEVDQLYRSGLFDEGYTILEEEYKDMYNLIEYEGKLYIPEIFIKREFKTPIDFKNDGIVEIGLKVEAISFADLGVEKEMSTDDAKEVKEGLELVLKDGEKYDSGIVLDNVTSEVSRVFLRTDYNYSEYYGVVYNTSEDTEMLLNITDIDGRFITELSLSPGGKTRLDNTLGGMEGIYIKVGTESTKGSKLVIAGEIR